MGALAIFPPESWLLPCVRAIPVMSLGASSHSKCYLRAGTQRTLLKWMPSTTALWEKHTGVFFHLPLFPVICTAVNK